jgi:hypothetical protein
MIHVHGRSFNLPSVARLRARGLERLLAGKQNFRFGLGCNCCGETPSGCVVTICVQGCGGGALAGAIVSVPNAVGSPSCTTVLSGSTACCQVNVTTEGSYQVTVSASGFFTYSNTLTLECNTTVTINLLPVTGNPSIEFAVFGVCGLPLAGALVTIGGMSSTTNASGVVDIGITDAGTFPWSVSKSRFVTATGSVTISACTPGNGSAPTSIVVTLAMAAGFAPAPCTGTVALADPVPNPMNLVDSIYGGGSLVWTPDAAIGFNWAATGGGEFPGINGCDPTDISVAWLLLDCTQECSPNGVSVVSTGALSAVGCPQTGPAPTTQGDQNISGFTADLSPELPFDMTITIPIPEIIPGVNFCAGVEGACIYPGGGTITITE